MVWLPFFIFPYIGNVIIPIDFHIFQRGGPTTNQSWDNPSFTTLGCHFLRTNLPFLRVICREKGCVLLWCWNSTIHTNPHQSTPSSSWRSVQVLSGWVRDEDLWLPPKLVFFFVYNIALQWCLVITCVFDVFMGNPPKLICPFHICTFRCPIHAIWGSDWSLIFACFTHLLILWRQIYQTNTPQTEPHCLIAYNDCLDLFGKYFFISHLHHMSTCCLQQLKSC